ncbi:MAG: matrixin family metalloprotease [Ilumatobacteraceae bacterium]
MLVRWGTSVDHPSLTGSVLGIGGFSHSPTQIVRGSVIVRSDLPFTTSKKGEDVLAGTLAHEMGHAFGLSHVNDPTQLMYAYANGLETYQAGDRTGLALLGAGQPCLSFPINRTEGAVPIGVGMDDPIGEVMVIDVAGPDGAHLHDEHDHDHHDEHDG